MRPLYIALLPLLMSACAAYNGPSNLDRLNAEIEKIKQPKGTRVASVTGANDPLEKLIKVSTQEYWTTPLGSDYFFRAFIDKTNGASLYQLYGAMQSDQWVDWNSARFADNGKLVELEAERVSTDVQCFRQGDCVHYEGIVVSLSRSQLESMSSPSPFRLSGRVSGLHHEFAVDPAEVRDFLKAVDGVKERRQ